MNSAYKNFLTTMLDKYDPSNETRQTIAEFLNWIDLNSNNEEPDLYEYGDTTNHMVIDYVDETLLTDYGVNTNTIPPDILHTILLRWAENTNKQLATSNLKEQTLDQTLQQIAIEHMTTKN